MQMSVACNLIPMGDRLDSDPTVDFLDKYAIGFNVFVLCRDAYINITPSVPECRVYSFLARILRHENFVHDGIISHGKNRGERCS